MLIVMEMKKMSMDVHINNGDLIIVILEQNVFKYIAVEEDLILYHLQL
jgi:hypothetical protein